MLAEPTPQNLEVICSVLNRDAVPELKLEMRRLVKAWQDEGANLSRLMEKDSYVRRAVKCARAELVAYGARAYWKPIPPKRAETNHKRYALAQFIALITSPWGEKLAGPCPRCDRYYIKKTERQMVYCSSSCGSAMTAEASIREARAAEHERKLRDARAASQEWIGIKTDLSCKEWIHKETKLSTQWISRAANKKELLLPTKEH